MMVSCLFLGLLLVGLLPHTLLPLALVAGVGPGLAQLAVGALVRLGDVRLADLGDTNRGDDGDDGGDLVGCLVGNLGLLALLGHDNELGLVGLEALDVAGERLLGKVAAAAID